MAFEAKRKIIQLNPLQVKWLGAIAPKKALERYTDLRKRKNPGGSDCLLDHGNFGNFLRGVSGRSMDIAESVFEVCGTNFAQVGAIGGMGSRFRLPCASDAGKEAEKKAVLAATTDASRKFFAKCGAILWNGAFLADESAIAEPIRTMRVDTPVLDLTGCVLEHIRHLDVEQKRTIFGELLDYLLETRQDDRWGQWMIALTREQNRKLFKKIRLNPGKNSWFECVRDGAKGYSKGDYDGLALRRLGREAFDECAFFVRRLNMRINELRSQHFRAYMQLRSGLSSARQKAMREVNKIFVRNYFTTALKYVKPFWYAAYEVDNPNKWYFMLCAARLFCDWARWNFHSVVDRDRVVSCHMFRDIRNAAVMCALDKKVPANVKCRFNYLAATACRYMAECTTRGIWVGETKEEYFKGVLKRINGREYSTDGVHISPRVYVEDAVVFANAALTGWEKRRIRDESKGESFALAYRFRRNYARLLTFAARWWLLNQDPNEYGDRDYLLDYSSPIEFRHVDSSGCADGPLLLKEAGYFCARSICAPLTRDEKGGGPIVLRGKRLLEYEFTLRVFIEMLAGIFAKNHTDRMIELPLCHERGEREKIEEDDARQAMSVFCRMVLIYVHLFLDLPRKDMVGTAITPATAAAARSWLGSHDFYMLSGEDDPFDVASLDTTRQGDPPALDETRFEIVCSFMYSASMRKRVSPSAIWVALNDIANGNLPFLKSRAWAAEFLGQVWAPASMALGADLADSVSIVMKGCADFEKAFARPADRVANYKEYPPFAMRFDLVEAPGNNPAHVDALMRHYDLDWKRMMKGESVLHEMRRREAEGGDLCERGREFSLKATDREGRQQAVDALFGEGVERDDLKGILFPETAGSRSADSSLSQFLNNGKSADVIQKAAEMLLSVDPMAGVPNLEAFGEDSMGENEFRTELCKFLGSAMSHSDDNFASVDRDRVRGVLSVITSMSEDILRHGESADGEKEVVKTLWNGIVAYIGSCRRLPFSFMSELCGEINRAMSASSYFCKDEIEALRTTLVPKTSILWRHSVHNQCAALESFRIYGQLFGRDGLNSSAIQDFMSSFGQKKHIGDTRLLHTKKSSLKE